MADVQRFDIRYRTPFHYDDVVRGLAERAAGLPGLRRPPAAVAYRVTTHPGAAGARRTTTTGARGSTPSASASRTCRSRSTPRRRSRRCPARSSPCRPGSPSSQRPALPRRPRRVPRARSEHTEWNGDVSAAAERIAAVTGDDVVGIVLALHRFVHTSLDVHARAPPTSASTSTRCSPRPRACARTTPTSPWRCAAASASRPATCRATSSPARRRHRRRRRRRRGAGADPRLVRGGHPRLGLAGPRPHQRPAGGPAPRQIGHGRDYDDVPPVRGVYAGGGRPSTDAVVEIRRHAPAVHQAQAQQQQ